MNISHAIQDVINRIILPWTSHDSETDPHHPPDWEALVAGAVRSPREMVEPCHPHGSNLLHLVACHGGTVAVLRRLHDAHPGHFLEACRCRADLRGTPLMLALHHGAPVDVLHFLIDVLLDNGLAAELDERDGNGRTALLSFSYWLDHNYRWWPFRIGWPDFSTKASKVEDDFLPLARKLVLRRKSARPSSGEGGEELPSSNNIGLERDSVDTYRRCMLQLQSVFRLFSVEFNLLFSSTATQLQSLDGGDRRLARAMWQLVELFVVGTVGRRPAETLLHELLTVPYLDCPLLLVMAESRLHPSHLMAVDGEGNTPLHVAVTGGDVMLIWYLVCEQPRAARVLNLHGATPLCLARRSGETGNFGDRWPSHVHGTLLQAHPAAVHASGAGPLPPVVWPYLFERLMASAPEGDGIIESRRCTKFIVYEILKSAPPEWVTMSKRRGCSKLGKNYRELCVLQQLSFITSS